MSLKSIEPIVSPQAPHIDGSQDVKDSDLPKVNFYTSIQPFVNLVNYGGQGINGYVAFFADIGIRAVSAAIVVFSRLIMAPNFNPTSYAFKLKIEAYEKQTELFESQIDFQKEKFNSLPEFVQDMHKLRELGEKIESAYLDILYYFNELSPRQHRFPIQDKLDSVKDKLELVNRKFEDFCLDNGPAIAKSFHWICQFFTKNGVELREDIRQQLLLAVNDSNKIFSSGFYRYPSHSNASEIQSIIHKIDILNQQIEQKSSTAVHYEKKEPLPLKNIGNSCYMDSALQALLCVDEIVKALNMPVISDPSIASQINVDELKKKIAISKEIQRFIKRYINEPEKRELTTMEYILALNDNNGPSLQRLRSAIFDSKLHSEFNLDFCDNEYEKKRSLEGQKEAAAIVELLYDAFMPSLKYKFITHTTTPELPGLEFMNGGKQGRVEELSTLIINFPSVNGDKKPEVVKGQEIGKEIITLDQNTPAVPIDAIEPVVPAQPKTTTHDVKSLIEHSLGKQNMDDGRRYELNEANVIQGEEAIAAKTLNERSPMGNEVKVKQHVEWRRITHLPPVMVIHFNRFQSGFGPSGPYNWKIQDDVNLPSDGIIDLTPFYDAPPGVSKEARYKIRSMVRHRGGKDFGHYIADVNIDDNYFHCDDSAGNRESSKDEFLGHKDVYMLVLEKVKD